jgi:hypothetical protein
MREFPTALFDKRPLPALTDTQKSLAIVMPTPALAGTDTMRGPLRPSMYSAWWWECHLGVGVGMWVEEAEGRYSLGGVSLALAWGVFKGPSGGHTCQQVHPP